MMVLTDTPPAEVEVPWGLQTELGMLPGEEEELLRVEQHEVLRGRNA